MAIKTMELTGLTAFEKATFEFVPGINVLLGANSTGKTHALKWLYGSVKALEVPDEDGELTSFRLRDKLQAVFLPERRRLSRLIRTGTEEGEIVIVADAGQVVFSIGTDTTALTGSDWEAGAPSVFLPSREVLALYEGFIAAYTNRELSIDGTYFDACVALNASLLRGPMAETAQPLIDAVEKLLGGKVELIGERFYVTFDEAPGVRREAHLVAEGLRKIASLLRLLQNGSIAPGGLLVWDEPESNLNPRLVAALVPILEALAKAGVQIVLATHDYLLTQRLSMISEAGSEDRPPVKLFLLSRPAPGAPVTIDSASNLVDLPRTPMEEEFLRLYDDEVKALRDRATDAPTVHREPPGVHFRRRLAGRAVGPPARLPRQAGLRFDRRHPRLRLRRAARLGRTVPDRGEELHEPPPQEPRSRAIGQDARPVGGEGARYDRRGRLDARATI